jgi:hypothetical protein
MNAPEFEKWFRDFSAKFPDAASWILKLTEAGGDPKRTKDSWAEALADVDLRDALEANRRLLAGDYEKPYREDFPPKVREIALSIKASKATRRADSEWRERRYSCAECLDTGRVEVVHYELIKAVAAVLRGGDPQLFWKCNYRVATARCGNCDLGKPRGILISEAKPGDKGPFERTARFSAERHSRVYFGDTEKQETAERIFADVQKLMDRHSQQKHLEFEQFADSPKPQEAAS